MQGRYVSYLDLMCCGFAGTMLMFLIVAAARSDARSVDRLLVVRCFASRSSTPVDRGELGLEYRAAGETVWRRAGQEPRGTEKQPPFFFTAPATQNSGTVAVFIWREPPAGVWQFQPYLADLSWLGHALPASGEEVAVSMEILSPQGVIRSEEPDILKWPGQWGRTVEVRVER